MLLQVLVGLGLYWREPIQSVQELGCARGTFEGDASRERFG
jgi:hypothetical protein